MPTTISPIENLDFEIYDNTTICAGKLKILFSDLKIILILLDQLISDALRGLSGRILWGIIQILLMMLGNIGKYIMYRFN
jgi:hypothetical protein